jgi:hypothetical protein
MLNKFGRPNKSFSQNKNIVYCFQRIFAQWKNNNTTSQIAFLELSKTKKCCIIYKVVKKIPILC